MDPTHMAIIGASIWLIILLLPWRPWAASEFLDGTTDCPREDLSDITVLIPARNEASVIETTLKGLMAQGPHLNIVLVDDRSSDGTARKAQALSYGNLRVVSGEPLPPGWSGKLWCLEQGLKHVDTGLVLLLDADILLKPGILRALRKKMLEEGIPLISIMAALRMVTVWERLLMPSFIYFFKMLYPFRLSNGRFPWVAAAAGGCILLKTEILREIGGFRALRNQLIDDCALARRIQSFGHKTWIGLSHSVCSLRPHDQLKTIWDMVARTAFNQLRYSTMFLFLCTAIMVVVFWLPVAGLFFPSSTAKTVSVLALGAMILSYLPTLSFYGLSTMWAFCLPAIGALYLAMTWTSAIRFWKGRGSEWKGRSYGSMPGPDRT